MEGQIVLWKHSLFLLIQNVNRGHRIDLAFTSLDIHLQCERGFTKGTAVHLNALNVGAISV
jgi:hypothetical protein